MPCSNSKTPSPLGGVMILYLNLIPRQIHGKTPFMERDSWKEGTDCCFFWDGVSCDFNTGYVIGLNLSSSMLYDNFHSNNSLFALHHLQKLDVSCNNFRGSIIPSQIGHLLSLTHLNLNHSNFDSQIPLEIGQLSNSVSLDLSQNFRLTLETIASFEKLIRNLTKLQELDLSGADLSFVSPNSFINLSISLSSLRLSSSGLRGKFPDSIIQLPHLEVLDLAYSFPSSNWSLSLYHLSLSRTEILVYLENEFFKNLNLLESLQLESCNFIRSNFALFGNLSKLIELDPSNNNFVGQIPLEIGQLSNLISLDLSWNSLLIQTTTSFNKLVRIFTKLQELDLGSTNLSLVSPNSFINLSSSLSSLTLSSSGLRGIFPNNTIQLPNLEILDLSRNEGLTSSLFISNWSISLTYLSLSSTKIPIYLENEFFKNLKLLQVLELNSCNFIGSNLELFGNLSKLIALDLAHNNFSGPFPSSIGKLDKLKYLNLSCNNFIGLIPPSFANLSQLFYLHMGSNNINGPIPSFIGNCNQLRYLVLSYNNFSGPIPPSFASLSQLSILSMESNNINGPIPSFIGNCNQLRYLSLSYNNFSGPIPSDICRLSSLWYLRLSNNLLTGQFSISWKLDASHSLSNEKLTGEIPSAVCNNFTGNFPRNLNNLETLDLSSNNLTGKDSIQLATLTSLEVFRKFRIINLKEPIPTGPQFNTFANSSYKENSRLLVDFHCKRLVILGEATSHDPSGEEDSNSDQKWILDGNLFSRDMAFWSSVWSRTG
ncbi:receptor-like protein 9DC3 [Jatropha curcas]|uniref:receptor-like protein 9DC3 n=1 Tax=Jatropha curcas TaxID=180498 RepID=UPI001895F0EF|nr:receptor-like protein 9DC3 [Jatropha curcas]